jgi:hypothetical protein
MTPSAADLITSRLIRLFEEVLRLSKLCWVVCPKGVKVSRGILLQKVVLHKFSKIPRAVGTVFV